MHANVRDAAAGRWPGILSALGILDERQLSGRHGPCPLCGGRDRFRFDDLEGRGTWLCSKCGAGSGVDLVMAAKGLGFRDAAKEIEQLAGAIRPGEVRKQTGEAERIERLRRVWSESKPLQDGDEAMRYFAGRGLALATVPDCLRLHPALPYFDGGLLVGKYPAMVARVVAPDGSGATLHRTYLQDGKKANVSSPRKLMPGKPIAGAAIRLAPAGEWLGIAEGIETAFAAAALFNCPVWSCVSAAGIESFEPPPGVTTLTIFADNDRSYTGQAAAFALAKRLHLTNVAAEVLVPDQPGTDWADRITAFQSNKERQHDDN